MADLALNPPPAIAAESTPRLLVLTAAFDRELGWKTDRMALSAVIEDRDGKIAYWALRHAEGKADFHHEAGFVSIEPRGRGSGFD